MPHWPLQGVTGKVDGRTDADGWVRSAHLSEKSLGAAVAKKEAAKAAAAAARTWLHKRRRGEMEKMHAVSQSVRLNVH